MFDRDAKGFPRRPRTPKFPGLLLPSKPRGFHFDDLRFLRGFSFNPGEPQGLFSPHISLNRGHKGPLLYSIFSIFPNEYKANEHLFVYMLFVFNLDACCQFVHVFNRMA